MCVFIGIVFKTDGRLLADPLINTYSMLQEKHNICKEYEDRDVCLVEITGNNGDLNSYHLNWEYKSKPDWWTDDLTESVEIRAKQIISTVIVGKDIIRGPVVNSKGAQFWYKNDKLHREDGPALTRRDGFQCWCQDGNRHREDGPAVIYPDGTQKWYRNDKIHREDGPARICTDGSQRWYLNGVEYTEEEYYNQIKRA